MVTEEQIEDLVATAYQHGESGATDGSTLYLKVSKDFVVLPFTPVPFQKSVALQVFPNFSFRPALLLVNIFVPEDIRRQGVARRIFSKLKRMAEDEQRVFCVSPITDETGAIEKCLEHKS